jgi:ATP:ADP antiporter, AAA family
MHQPLRDESQEREGAPAPNPRTLALYPILAVAFTGAAFSLIKTGRDAVFFSNIGLADLPWAYLWTEIGLGFAAQLHLGAMRRWGTRRSRVGVFVLSAIAFVVFSVLMAGGASELVRMLFPIVPVVFAALFSTAWLLAGDLLDGAPQPEVQRAYGLIGAAAMLGGIGGALGAKALGMIISAPYLVAAGGVLLFGGAAICVRGHAQRQDLAGRIRTGQVRARSSAGPEALNAIALLKHPYTRVLLIISAVASLTAMYTEFQFYAAAMGGGAANAQFFANYYIVLCVASLIFQIVITPRIQSRFGVSRALMILPFGVLGGAGLVALTTTVMTQSVFRVVETSLKNSIHRSSWEQVFLHFDPARRAAIKVMIDGAVSRIAGIAGALALHFLMVERVAAAPGSLALVTAVAGMLIPIAAFWLFMTRALERTESPITGSECKLEWGEDGIRLPDS